MIHFRTMLYNLHVRFRTRTAERRPRVQIFVQACDLKCRWASRAAISCLDAAATLRATRLQPLCCFHSPFVGRAIQWEREREREKAGSNIRFKLSNWIFAPEALGSGSKFAKRARNANRDGEDRYWAERIGPFERSLDFQSRLQTCANITVRYMSGVPLFANYLYKSTITSNRIFYYNMSQKLITGNFW